MRRILILLVLIPVLAMPVCAETFTAPQAPLDAQQLLPAESENFGADLWKVILTAIEKVEPEIAESASICVCVLAVLLLVSLLGQLPGQTQWVLEFGATVGICLLLLGTSTSMIRIASDTVQELSDYGKLLLPVMTAAMSAQGGVTSGAALYAGTVALDTVVGSLISHILIPAVYIFIALRIAHSASGDAGVGTLAEVVKWFGARSLKTMLYLFTGFLGITGVVSGTADAAALKATKLSISGMVPVVGGILSDASEAVLLGAGVVMNGVGIYGLMVIAAIWITPFLRIGILYLMLKVTGGICAGFSLKRVGELVQGFCAAMGLLLAMIGTMSMLLLVSTVCFMKGVG